MSTPKGNIAKLLGAPLIVETVEPVITHLGDGEVDVDFVRSSGEPDLVSFSPESEWCTAAPSAPLHGQAPARVESPQRPSFDDVFDQLMWEDYCERAPQFEILSGRFNPFVLDRLRELMEGEHFSTFLRRPIITFKDACDHGIQLALFWADEDASMVRAPVAIRQPLAPGKKDEQVEQARIDWKNAVAERNRIIAEQNDIVAAARKRYQDAKRKR